MRRLALSLLLVMLLAPGVGRADEPGSPPQPGKEPQPARAGPARPATYGLAKLRQEIEALRARLAWLKAEADKDWRERKIEEYERYTAEDFVRLKKRVDAKDLGEYAFDDPEAPFEAVRMRAVEALLRAKADFRDPDLTTQRRSSSSQSPLALFCQRRVVPELRSDDAKSRALADKLLKGLWGTPATLPGSRGYKPQKKFRKTWGPAISDWKRHLRRR